MRHHSLPCVSCQQPVTKRGCKCDGLPVVRGDDVLLRRLMDPPLHRAQRELEKWCTNHGALLISGPVTVGEARRAAGRGVELIVVKEVVWT